MSDPLGRKQTGGRVAMLAGGGELARIVFHALDPAFDVCGVIIEEKPSLRSFLGHRVRRLGTMTVAGQLAFRVAMVPLLRATSRRRIAIIRADSALDVSPIDEACAIPVPSVNSPACRDALATLAPDVVVVVGTRIIGRSTLAAITVPFINFHTGITPMYRGVYGAYWALVMGDRKNCGVTIHLIDEGVDTGPILGSATIQPSPEDNVTTYPFLQAAAGLGVLRAVIQRALAGDLVALRDPEGPSRMWSHPTLIQYLFFRLSRGVK